MISWYEINNLHCYCGENRPQDGAKIIAKIKYEYLTGQYKYKLMFGHYEKKEDLIWNIEVEDQEIDVPFKNVVSWIYINELMDSMK